MHVYSETWKKALKLEDEEGGGRKGEGRDKRKEKKRGRKEILASARL